MARKMIHIGAGGFGELWCRSFIPPNVADGLVEVVAAADMNPETFVNAKEGLGLRDDQCYTDVKKALDENPADFCSIVVPPAFHEQMVDLALDHGLDIISEKPIADTLEASIRIANKVRDADKKMGVTMSHRFDQDKTTLRQEIRSGRYGKLDYLVSRYSIDARKFGSWGDFRHEMADALLIEGAVHHLDILADLAGALCDTLYAQTWKPDWAEYAGDCQALVTMHHANGVRAFYEGANANAVGLNGWCKEYFRAECEGATLILNHRRLERFVHGEGIRGIEGQGEEIPLIEQPKWSNMWLIDKFVRWLDGGEPMETNVEDNLQSIALVFAGVQSSHSGNPVEVQRLLAT